MDKFKVRMEGEKKVYVHNDLSNGAFHFLERINKRIEDGDREGIAYDMMACLVLLAFTFESKINFLGDKVVENWKEREKFHIKVSQVFDALELNLDKANRPYKSIDELKQFRDLMAHGKPVETEIGEELVVEHSEIYKGLDLSHEWEKFCTQEFVNHCYADILEVWKELLGKSDINPEDTITSGYLSTTILGSVTD